MTDLKTLSKAKMELEELYLGIPDDSVNLTFQDLADVKQQNPPEKMKKSTFMEPICELPKAPKPQPSPPLAKLPSLDFTTALQASNNNSSTHHRQHRHHLDPHATHELGHNSPFDSIHEHHLHRQHELNDMHEINPNHHHHHLEYGHSNNISVQCHQGHAAFSRAYDDMSVISTAAPRGRRARRPGIPHSNICTVCSTYIYVFRHRCLVCGRVYCRNCVSIGMGEMTEGRKCIECLGRRFSQRYIQKAGKVGCCSMYPSSVKQEELKWAEKGPRRSDERGYAHSTMMSRSRSPVTQRTVTGAHHASSNPPSFVTSSPYSPYRTPNHYHLPL